MVIPPPPLGPLPRRASYQVGAPLVTQGRDTSHRGAGYSSRAGPATGPGSASSVSGDVRSRGSPKFLKREIVTTHYRGSRSGSDEDERYRLSSPSDDSQDAYSRDRTRRVGDAVEVEIQPARSAKARSYKSRSSGTGRDTDTSREWREKRERYTHYIVPAAGEASSDIIREVARKHQSYPQASQDRHDDDGSRRMTRSRPQTSHAPTRESHRRASRRSPSRGRYSSSESPPPSRPRPRSRQLTQRTRTPPPTAVLQRPASYASHNSSAHNRRSSVTVKSAGAGVDYVISNEVGLPAASSSRSGRGNPSGIGITTIRVIPRENPILHGDTGRDREMGRSRNIDLERDRMSSSVPRTMHANSQIAASYHSLRQSACAAPTQTMDAIVQSPPTPPPGEGRASLSMPYAKTLAPCDSISSAGDPAREREREWAAATGRLRDRMELGGAGRRVSCRDR